MGHTKETIQKKKRSRNSISTEQYIEELKKSPNYSHINWDHEIEEMRLWCLKPENTGRQITPRFVLNWVKKISKPLSLKNGKSW